MCNPGHHLESFEPVLMQVPRTIVRPAVTQAKLNHLILLGNVEQLLLSPLLAKATVKSKHMLGNWGLVSTATLIHGNTTCCLTEPELTFFCHSIACCQLLQLSS